MKKITVLFLSCALFAGGNIFAISGNSLSEKAEAILIKVKGSTVPPSTPRSQGEVQITAEYESGVIYATLANAGTSVDVSIENLSTGESYNNAVSGNGIAVLPISGTPGTWVITFTLSGGEVYVGEFEL